MPWSADLKLPRRTSEPEGILGVGDAVAVLRHRALGEASEIRVSIALRDHKVAAQVLLARHACPPLPLGGLLLRRGLLGIGVGEPRLIERLEMMLEGPGLTRRAQGA